MNKNKRKICTIIQLVGLCLVVLLASGCVTKSYLTRDSLAVLKPGLSVVDVKKLTQKNADYITTVKENTAIISVNFYRVQTGSRQDTSMICGQYGCNPIFVSVPVLEPFMMLYKDNKLIGWGLAEQMRSEGSETQKSIANIAFLDYANHLKEKNEREEKEAEQNE